MFHKPSGRLLFLTLLIALLLGVIPFLPTDSDVTAEELATTATAEKIVVSLSQDVPTWLNDKLYTLDPDGSNLISLYDFSGRPKTTSGRMLDLRAHTDGQSIHFASTHDSIYTPAGYNIFELWMVGKVLDQVTPGPNSGDFTQTGNSTVSGVVQNGSGAAYIGSPVYLEGMGVVNTAGDGTFSFTNVPAGARWLVAYNVTLDLFEARSITVVSNLHTTGLVMVPNTTARMNFRSPVPYGDTRIYHIGNGGFDIDWTTADFAGPTTVYTTPSDACAGIATVDAFDISTAGKIVVYDYQTGCGIGNMNHVGLYTMDSDGGNKQILKDMLNDAINPLWDDPVLPVEIFWSPDGTQVAVKVSYGSTDNIIVFDTSGAIVGSAHADTISEVVTLYGWSPDGNWLLFGSYDGNPAATTLGKIVVNGDGSLGAVTNLLTNQPISGATWGNLVVVQNVYLPLAIR